MKKIKIVHFSQVGGGVDRYIKLYLKYSNHDNFESVVVGTAALKKANYKDNSVAFYEIDVPRSFSPVKVLKATKVFKKIVESEKPDIVYLHSTFAGVIGRLACINQDCKVVYNPHGWSFKMDVNYIKRRMFENIEKFLSVFTDSFIMISNSELEEAKNIGINTTKLNRIYNGIDTSVVLNSEKRNFQDRYVIGMVGRITNQKNPIFFVEFAKKILDKHPDTYFIVVGDGELRRETEKLLKSYGITDSFLITGWVDNVYDYIREFDQAVLFSKWEGFGLAVVEYMLSRKPTIITDIDGMSELIDNGVTGFKIEPGDINSAVGYSELIRSNKQLTQNIIEAAYQNVLTNFDVKDNVSSQEKLFIKLLEGER